MKLWKLCLPILNACPWVFRCFHSDHNQCHEQEEQGHGKAQAIDGQVASSYSTIYLGHGNNPARVSVTERYFLHCRGETRRKHDAGSDGAQEQHDGVHDAARSRVLARGACLTTETARSTATAAGKLIESWNESLSWEKVPRNEFTWAALQSPNTAPIAAEVLIKVPLCLKGVLVINWIGYNVKIFLHVSYT